MKKIKKMQFSKVVIAGVMMTYFLAVLVVCYIVVLIDCSQVGVLATFVGTQTTSALGFYLWKAKAENEIKIRKGSGDNGRHYN